MKTPSLPSSVRSRRGRSFRPRLEVLEARTVLSTLTVFDAGPGSLRAAVASATPGDTIVFASQLAGSTITLTSGELAVTTNLNVVGPGAARLTIDGNTSNRLFEVSAGVSLSLSGLTLANG